MRGNIDEVAKHGEVLALFASIQAVTAGESGRGFAVLAQKLRDCIRDIADENERPSPRRDLSPLAALEYRRGDLQVDLNRVGELGGHEGVKLEQPVWLSADGPVILSEYPFELDYL